MSLRASNVPTFIALVLISEIFMVNCNYPPAADESDEAWQITQEQQLHSADDPEWQYTLDAYEEMNEGLISDESLEAGGETIRNSNGELLTFSPCNNNLQSP
jgi:hypothetical protein